MAWPVRAYNDRIGMSTANRSAHVSWLQRAAANSGGWATTLFTKSTVCECQKPRGTRQTNSHALTVVPYLAVPEDLSGAPELVLRILTRCANATLHQGQATLIIACGSDNAHQRSRAVSIDLSSSDSITDQLRILQETQSSEYSKVAL